MKTLNCRLLTKAKLNWLAIAAGGILVAAPHLHAGPTQAVSAHNPNLPLPAGGNGDSVSPVISADGRFVLFSSSANNLVPGDNGQFGLDVFLRDRASNTIVLVSANFSGTGGGNGNSTSGQISTNGRYVAFQSDSSDLLTDDTNGVSDIYVRDLQLGSNILVSVASDGGWANGASTDPVLTPDGRYVVFISAATNLVAGDTNGITDVFVRDLLNGTTTLASVGATGTTVTVSTPVITPDGRYVAFASTAKGLDPGVSASSQGEVYVRDLVANVTTWASTNAANTFSNLFSHLGFAPSSHPVISSDGHLISFKTVAPSGNSKPVDLIFQYNLTNATLTSISSNGFPPWDQNDDVYGPEMSPDGRFVVFVATNSGCLTVQLWDAQAATNLLVSAALDGSYPTNSVSTTPAVSPDGRYVAFLSNATNLVANGIASGWHIYRRDVLAGVTQLVATDTNGVGSTDEIGTIPSMSEDGQFIAFAGHDGSLVPSDNNGTYDVFLRDTVNATNELLSQHSPLPGTSTGNLLSGFGAVSLSADGHRLVYASYASDLVTNDFNKDCDVFMTDLQAGSTTLVSVGLDGNTASGGSSTAPAISADGHFVASASTATNLVANDTNGAADIFLRNLDTGVTTLININSNGVTSGTGDASTPAISANGRYVAFLGKATPSATYPSVFWKDTIGGRMVTINGAAGNGPSISADGQRVLWFSSSQLLNVWNAPTLANIYTFGSAVSLAVLSPTGTRVAYQNTSTKQLVVYNLSGSTNMFTCTDATPMKNTSAWSSDGRYLVFVTGAPLVANDNNGTNDVYLCDLQTGMVNLISANSDWTASANGVSDSPSISGDGRFIVFRSFAANILPGISNVPTLFVFDRMTGSNSLLATPAPNDWTSYATLPIVSSNGNSVVFQSWNVAGITNDLNRVQDVFVCAQDSLVTDSDGDGIPDWWMVKYFGHATGQPSDLSRAQDDADGDGLSNLQEYLAGTAPTNFNSVLVLQVSPVTVASNTVSLTWPAVPGKSYQVQYKNDLNASNWTNYSGSISLISRQGVIAVPASQATRFFRAVCVP
jgi:Tol biopolymer transport system component